MRLLWAYGTLCCHPHWFLWLEQRTTGWRSGRSEGNSKSLSARYVPTDLLLLTQQTSVRFLGGFTGPSHGAPSISFGVPSEDRMSIAASGNGLTSSEDEGAVGMSPSGVVATAAPDPELTVMLDRAVVSIGLEVNRPPSPEPSWLNVWFLRAGRGSQPRSAPVPFFPEVHEELTKSWMAPFTARSRSSVSSVLAESTPRPARRASGRRAAPLCPSQAPSCLGSQRSGPDVGNPEMLEFDLSWETARTPPLLPLEDGRE